MGKEKKVIITEIHKSDDHYSIRKNFIGLTGRFEPVMPHRVPGYWTGRFFADDKDGYSYFRAIRYRKI